MVELLHELVSFMFNMKIPGPKMYQDNTSVIMLVTQGGGMA